MSKTLAEMRKSDAVGPPEFNVDLCLAQKLVRRAQLLEEERKHLVFAAARKDAEGNATGPVRRASEGPNPRIAEIETELGGLYDEMREHEGTLHLRGVSSGEWQRWVEANPPRKDSFDENGQPVVSTADENAAYGLCNATALLGRLGDFVIAWNDEPISADDWAWLRDQIAPGDMVELARKVVQMHAAGGIRAPFSSTGSSKTPPSETV